MYCLLEKGIAAGDISVLASYLPGDESINYTSPYAGGNFSIAINDSPEGLARDRFTYTNLAKLQTKLGGPSQCGLDRYMSYDYGETNLSEAKVESLMKYGDEVKLIKKSDLPEGTIFGIQYRSWNFNCPFFLKSLYNYLSQLGVKFIRKKLSNIEEAYDYDTEYVFNCTGIGARSLGGINDEKVFPTRGQVVIVKSPHICENVLRWGEGYATYVIKRPYSHDHLVLGGFMQKNDWTADTFSSQTEDILERTTKLFPKILQENPHGNTLKDLEIVKVSAGLRPSREGGPRIEAESLKNGKILIHNYGSSGYGYQSGLGMAHEAVSLIGSRSKL